MADQNASKLSPNMVLLFVLLGGGVSGTATNLFSKSEAENNVAISNYEIMREHRIMKDEIQNLKTRVNSLEVFFINRGNNK